MLFKKETYQKSIIVDGMSCSHCVKRIEEGLKEMKDVKKVDVSLENKTVTITSSKEISMELIKEKIEEIGYQFVSEKEQ